MNKDEIKKALVLCQMSAVSTCRDCPYTENCDGTQLYKDALDLITEQEKENEKLEQLNAIQCDAWQKLSDENESLAMENSSNFRYNSVLRKENKKLEAENQELVTSLKQAQVDTIDTIVKYCEDPNHWNELKDCKLWGGKSDDLRNFLNGIFKEVENDRI